MHKFRPDYAGFAVLLSVILWLLISASGCATSHTDPRAELAAEEAIISGHLAAKPQEALGGRRLVIYLGDYSAPPVAPGEDIPPPGPLTNIRKAVSDEHAERKYLRDLYLMLKGDPEADPPRPGWKIGAEGPVLLLYGEHPEGQHAEMVRGADFVFCFAEYRDPVTGRDDTVDLCYGGRLRDKALRVIGERAMGIGGKGLKLVNPLD